MVNLEVINNLWLQIDKLHLIYLQTEDSPLRIDQKRKLEGIRTRQCGRCTLRLLTPCPPPPDMLPVSSYSIRQSVDGCTEIQD